MARYRHTLTDEDARSGVCVCVCVCVCLRVRVRVRVRAVIVRDLSIISDKTNQYQDGICFPLTVTTVRSMIYQYDVEGELFFRSFSFLILLGLNKSKKSFLFTVTS